MNPGGQLELDAVVLLHGVGLDPHLFDPLMSEFTRQALPSAVALLRPAYRDGVIAPDSVEEQAESLLAEIASLGRVAVVGLSGGATLAVAMAVTGHRCLAGVIAHEPLVGPLAPSLFGGVVEAADRLASDDSAGAAERFVCSLVGPAAWDALPASAREFVAEHAGATRGEVPQFVAFTPTTAELAKIRVPLLVTTGADSARPRHEAAAILQGISGCGVAVIENAGHLAPWEQPARYASVVGSTLSTWGRAA